MTSTITPPGAHAYPVRVEAALDPPLSRWLWLVKWLLAIPHFVILAFLWVAFGVLSVGAFFAILFTGRYPRSIFEFNVGVLRWSWRVGYYAYGVLGTDRYPPFTLAEVPDYPAHLDVAYPDHLSRGLVLVKWWLLALPQYIVVAVFAGGGAWAAWQAGSDHANWGGMGLIGVLVLIAAVVLLFTGSYPRPIYDFVLGMNRWVLRVAAYAALMTDEYPPFRLDQGGHDPGGAMLTVPSGPGAPPTAEPAPPQAPAGPGARGGWTPLRIVSVVAGAVLVLVSLGMFAGGGAALWADQTQRENGYVTSGTDGYTTSGYALASDEIRLWGASSTLGKVRIDVTPVSPAARVFVGIAPTAFADRYLQGVRYDTVKDFGTSPTYATHGGGAPAVRPGAVTSWVASVAGTGRQSLVWKAEGGHWTVVVMNANAAPGVSVQARIGATLPWLFPLALGLLTGAVPVLLGGVALIALPVRRASRPQPA